MTTPLWLNLVAVASLVISVLCAVMVGIDVSQRPQRMGIMNVVWPVTALWAGPLGLWAYRRWGRAAAPEAAQGRSEQTEAGRHAKRKQRFSVLTAKAASHCGSGCALGDIAAELLIVVAPLTLFGKHIFGAWIYDFIFAYILGIVFQYLTIKPMRDLSFKRGVVEAIKADTASLVAWQVGMYGWMAIATFAIFRHELSKASPVFWFMMQIAMLCGFLTAYPVNWLLLRRGVKEPM